ncbi:MAG TPA: STAS/SEC14 domain-containing protein [Cyclobacteriaceae bacterium]|nr:STAS/SEC14 domain-containing protein [Cyclobacteriaceae bacterium]
MVQILGDTDGKVIAAKATRSITENDYHKLLPLFINKSKYYPVVRLYLEVAAESEDLGVFCDHLRFKASHTDNMDRVALVGDPLCQELLPKLMELFSSTEIRFFLLDEKAEALAWVHGENAAAERFSSFKSPSKSILPCELV